MNEAVFRAKVEHLAKLALQATMRAQSARCMDDEDDCREFLSAFHAQLEIQLDAELTTHLLRHKFCGMLWTEHKNGACP